MSYTLPGPLVLMRVGLPSYEASKGEKKAKIYGKRGYFPIDQISAAEIIKRKLSLMIPSYFTEMKMEQYSENGHVGCRYPDFLKQVKNHVQYFGYIDLDMDLDSIKQGTLSLFHDDPAPRTYDKTIDVKNRFSEWIKLQSHLTVGDMRQKSKPFDDVCKDALMIYKAVQSYNPILFFSGLKGFRVLWLDPKLFYWVYGDEDYSAGYKKTIAPRYFLDLGIEDPGFISRLDTGVYDRDKGIKPDLVAHPDSGLFPTLIYKMPDEYTDFFNGAIIYDASNPRTEIDSVLKERIESFWIQVPKLCPKTIPILRYQSLEYSLPPPLPVVRREYYKSDNTTTIEPPSDSIQMDLEEFKAQRAPDEYRERLLNWVNGNGSKKYASLDSIIYKEKYKGNKKWIIVLREFSYCPRKKENHSAATDISYIVDAEEGRLSVTCLSTNCAKQGSLYPFKYPIWRSNVALNNAATYAKSKEAEKRKKNPEEEEEENTEPNHKKPKKVEPAAPLVQRPPAERIRYFSERFKAKQYYKDQFKDSINIYPVIQPLNDPKKQNVQDEQIKLDLQSIIKQNKDWEKPALKVLLYLVVYNPGNFMAFEWGYISASKLVESYKRINANQVWIQQKDFTPGPPLHRMLAIQAQVLKEHHKNDSIKITPKGFLGGVVGSDNLHKLIYETYTTNMSKTSRLFELYTTAFKNDVDPSHKPKQEVEDLENETCIKVGGEITANNKVFINDKEFIEVMDEKVLVPKTEREHREDAGLIATDWDNIHNPGEETLNLNTRNLKPEWKDLRQEMLYFMYDEDNEEKPGTWTSDLERDASAELKKQNLPSCAIQRLFPNMWLGRMLRILKFKDNYISDTLFDMGRMAVGRAQGRMWQIAKRKYNEHVTMLVELFKYKKVEEENTESKNSDLMKVDWKDYPNPGEEELEASLDSVNPDWVDVPEDLLRYHYRIDESPPASFTDEMKSNFVSLTSKALPPMWLGNRMRLLNMKEGYITTMCAKLDTMATSGKSEGKLWRIAKIYYNEMIKMLIELFKYKKMND